MNLALHIKEAIEWTARQHCRRSNCGTVCLCGPCHARKVVEIWNNMKNKKRENFGGLTEESKRIWDAAMTAGGKL